MSPWNIHHFYVVIIGVSVFLQYKRKLNMFPIVNLYFSELDFIYYYSIVFGLWKL